MRLRHSVRGLLVDDEDRLLLYRFTVPGGGPVVWTPPGGGVEVGESLLDAVARELDEETGLQDIGEPVHVWHQQVADPTLLAGWGGVMHDYFVIRTPSFEPLGSLSPAELAAELVGDFAWWEADRLGSHTGPEVFGPRELPRLFRELLSSARPLLRLTWKGSEPHGENKEAPQVTPRSLHLLICSPEFS